MNVKCRLCGKPYKLVGKKTDALVCEECFQKIIKEHLGRVQSGVKVTKVTVHYDVEDDGRWMREEERS
jgi:DNA-directed RNA polymerase subunit RPC12/RpoP